MQNVYCPERSLCVETAALQVTLVMRRLIHYAAAADTSDNKYHSASCAEVSQARARNIDLSLFLFLWQISTVF